MAKSGDPKFVWEILRLDGLLVLALAGQAGHAKAPSSPEAVEELLYPSTLAGFCTSWH